MSYFKDISSTDAIIKMPKRLIKPILINTFHSKRNLIIYPLVIVALGLILHFPLLNSSFSSDDFNILNKIINRNIFEENSNFFRPLNDLSIYFDYLLWGKNPFGFHLTNIVLNIFTALLIYYLVHKFHQIITPESEKKNTQFISLITAIIFITFPFHNEAVAWIAGRGAVLATFFSTLSFYFYLSKSKNIFSLNTLISLLFFFISLFVYESVWIFPLIIIFTELYFFNSGLKNFKTVITISILYLFVFGIYIIIRGQFVNGVIGTYGTERYLNFDFFELILNSFRLISRTFLPPFKNSIYFVLTFITFSFLTIVLYFNAYKKKYKKISFHLYLITLYLATLIPFISLGIDTHDTEGERFLYLSSVFISLAVAYIIFDLQKSLSLKISLFILIISYNIIFQQISNSQWKHSSLIVNNILNSISELPDSKNFYISNLPEQYKGAFIFRNGFTDAINLFVKKNKFKKIIILSKQDVSNCPVEKIIPKKVLNKKNRIHENIFTNYDCKTGFLLLK